MHFRLLVRRVLLAVALHGCGNGLSGLEAEATPIVTLHVEFDAADLHARLPGLRLWVALVWGAPWENPAICYVTDHEVVQQACMDPYLFRPGEVAHAIPLEQVQTGEATFELFTAPDNAVAVGGPDGRIAYGSIAVLAGTPMLEEDLERQIYPPYQLAGASFLTLVEPHRRVVFRQGNFDAGSHFYPYAVDKCGEPPVGFSLLDVIAPAGDGSCRFVDPGAVITPRPVSAEQSTAWSCPPSLKNEGNDDPHAVEEPTNEYNPLGPTMPEDVICTSHEILVLNNSSWSNNCPSFGVWALKACSRNLLCDDPEWDWTANPPFWWPCD